MKFEWIEEGDGRYRVQFFDMDEKKVFDIKITDYSDPYWQQSDLERKIRRECCYDVIFCESQEARDPGILQPGTVITIPDQRSSLWTGNDFHDLLLKIQRG